MGRALRIAGVGLGVLGSLAALLGLIGYIATSVHLANIKCPEDASCIDRVMGHGIYGTISLTGVVVAGVGGLLTWQANAGAQRRRRWDVQPPR